MTKVTGSLDKTIEEKLKDSEKRQGLSDRESKGFKKFDQLIEGNNILELQKFDFREEILEVIYENNIKKVKDTMFVSEFKEINKNNVIQKTAFGKKWAVGDKEDFDYDSSYLSTYVFSKTILRQCNCESIDRKETYTVQIQCQEIGLSGDTMNSWATTLEKFLGEYGKDYFEGDVPREGNKLWGYLSDGENYKYGKLKKPLPSYITDFLDVVYTIGNFVPVPFVKTNKEFNRPRNSNSTKDYWDLALKVIYEWYKGDTEKQRKNQILEKLVGKKEGNIELCAQWLDLFGDGIDGWNEFIERNYMQPFVKDLGEKKYGEPWELWDGHFDAVAIKEKPHPKNEKQFKQFFVNARERILARGWLIAEALINNAKKDVPDEKGNG